MFLAILGLAALVGVWLVSAYNRLVALRQRYGQAFSDIDVQLKQRHDLVPNLVETVKGDPMTSTARSKRWSKRAARRVGAGTGGQAAPETALSGALGRLIAVSEAYPDLKANTNFQQLESELADLENKIAAAGASSTTRPRNITPHPGRSRRAVRAAIHLQAGDFFDLEEGELKDRAGDAAGEVLRTAVPAMEPATRLRLAGSRRGANAPKSGASRRHHRRWPGPTGFIRIFHPTGFVRLLLAGCSCC